MMMNRLEAGFEYRMKEVLRNFADRYNHNYILEKGLERVIQEDLKGFGDECLMNMWDWCGSDLTDMIMEELEEEGDEDE